MVSRLGKYLLLEHVNQGGMADVFLAKTFGFGGADQLIALKCIRPEVQADEDFVSMFVDEAKLSALLSHANIAKTYELGRINDAYFIAMEYVSGRDVRALIDRARARNTEIPAGLALFIVAAVLDGLDYAHRKTDLTGQALRIVHSDVSPKNVLVGYAGEVKLIDFGIARAVGATAAEGRGAVGYMSPEQVRGDAVDARSDLFAVGTLMFELLTRSRLFDGATDNDVRDKVKNAEVFPPTLVNPSLPAEIEAIVMRALARRPDDRYASAESMHREVVEVMLRRFGNPQSRELGNFVRKLFDEEHRADLARIERAMQLQTLPENVPEHQPGLEPTAMVRVPLLAPLVEETTSPEATRFASILPSGEIITHPFAKPAAAAAAIVAATAATASASTGATPPVVGLVTTGESVAPKVATAQSAAGPVTPREPATAPSPKLEPPPLKPQPMSELEPTDVDDEPDGDTAVVMRDAGTDPKVMRFEPGAQAARQAADADDGDDPIGGDTAIVRTDGTRIGTLLDTPQREEDDFTDRLHKSLAILGINEDSDAGIEPTQVAFKADQLQRSSAGAAPVTGPIVPLPDKIKRETAESLAAIGITPARGGPALEDDSEDSTDRVLRDGANIEQVPREITLIDHSRRAAAVDDWARESRGRLRSSLRRAVLIGLFFLVVGIIVVGWMAMRRNGRLNGLARAPAVGSLVVISSPNGAEVLIDGSVVGTTPFSSQKVPVGLHQLVVRTVAGKQRALEVIVKEREAVTREVNLSD